MTKHICNQCAKKCNLKGMTIIDCVEFENNGIEKSVEQTEKTRWVFDMLMLRTVPLAKETDARWFFKDGSSWGKVYVGFYIEVQERDLPYLEKPDGDWVFKKVEVGEEWMMGEDDDTKVIHSETTTDNPSKYKEFCGFLQGYRWVREVVTDLDGIPVTVSREDADIWCENGRFVEYPVYAEEDFYWCDVEHLTEDGDPCCDLHQLQSIVGFAGVQFEDSCLWCMDGGRIIVDGEMFRSTNMTDCKPATPIKARFWVG